MILALELFVMLVLANGAPVVARNLCGRVWSTPIDGGRRWRDGQPVLGKSKTWRGLVSGTLSCGLFAMGTGLDFVFGCLFGALGLIGDMISSFIKRRCGLVASARALLLDQVPEAALPMLLALFWLPLGLWSALAVAVAFTLSNILLSPLLYRLGIRRQPH